MRCGDRTIIALLELHHWRLEQLVPLLLQQVPILPRQQVAVRPPARHHLLGLLLVRGRLRLLPGQRATELPPLATLKLLPSLAVVHHHRRRLPQGRVPPHYLIALAVRARRPAASPITVVVHVPCCAGGSSASSSAFAIRSTITRQPTSLITHSNGQSRAQDTWHHWSP